MKVINREITVKVKSFELDGILIKEKGPRIAICQDRVCLLSAQNEVLYSRDLLDTFGKGEIEEANSFASSLSYSKTPAKT
jgi:hypothetical protein